MRLIREWLARRKFRREAKLAQRVRHIPDGYFDGYRRLAPTASAIVGQHCWNCRHAVAYVSWHCDLDASKGCPPCKWEPCYVADQLTRADLKAGNEAGCVTSRWLGLPPEPAA